jgi:nuclear factor erythroid 2-related factor 1/3
MHNHTYLSNSNGYSSDSNAETYHPYSYKNKLKKQRAAAEEGSLSKAANRQQEIRDMQLLKANNIGLELSQVIDSSAEELSELIQACGLDKDQINVIKDIRRRGKNKVAAQICRKRKLDSIDSLKEDVTQLKELKARLHANYRMMHDEIKEMTLRFDSLYKEATAGSLNFNSNDPIASFISNLKQQLNIRPGTSQQATNSETHDSRSNNNASKNKEKSSGGDLNSKKFRKL